MVGIVVSTKMKNTAVVRVDFPKAHPLYKKSFMRSKKYLLEDQIGVSAGDIVEFIKIRPISKRKHFQVVKVLGKDMVEIEEGVLKKDSSEAIAEVMSEEVEKSEEIGASEKLEGSEELKKAGEKKEKKEKKAKEEVTKEKKKGVKKI